MAITALVTGSAGPVGEVVAALRAAGAEAVGVADADQGISEAKSFSPGSLDCYVQLPVVLNPAGETVVAFSPASPSPPSRPFRLHRRSLRGIVLPLLSPRPKPRRSNCGLISTGRAPASVERRSTRRRGRRRCRARSRAPAGRASRAGAPGSARSARSRESTRASRAPRRGARAVR